MVASGCDRGRYLNASKATVIPRIFSFEKANFVRRRSRVGTSQKFRRTRPSSVAITRRQSAERAATAGTTSQTARGGPAIALSFSTLCALREEIVYRQLSSVATALTPNVVSISGTCRYTEKLQSDGPVGPPRKGYCGATPK
ncbi:hypothetical protein HPB50_026555 [Hyalomma asiaticum]|uniref:Uncharacterized protein n=1 Tax=Hyalomma asiaticum TaxID=266040 RepID=A0ACB7TUW7_HYAAI|nr:hypothetical protein HPB50_026555 [Hyalomma asiaticum]